MQRRVDQPDRHGQAVHRREDLHEVVPLQREQRIERCPLVRLALGEDQPLDVLAPLAEEHVLGAAQADPLGPEAPRPLGVLAVVGVGAHAEAAGAVRVGDDPVHGCHQRIGIGLDRALEVLHDRAGYDGNLAEEDRARGAVDRDDVALAEGRPTLGGDLLALDVDLEVIRARHAGLAHAARDDGSVRGLATAAGQDAAAAIMPGRSSGLVSRRTRMTCLTAGRPLRRGDAVEDDLADRSARARR